MLQDGPRLPMSLASLHLETGSYSTDLTELSSGRRWLDAAAKPVLIVESYAVCFSLVALASGRNAERLPDGFSGLELHTTSITIQCSAVPSRTRMPTVEEVAWELFQLFADAPTSYRHFILRWHDIFPVIIHLAGHYHAASPVMGAASFDECHAVPRRFTDVVSHASGRLSLCEAMHHAVNKLQWNF